MRQARTFHVLYTAPVVASLIFFYRSYETIGTDVAGWFSGMPLFDMIEKETGGDYKN